MVSKVAIFESHFDGAPFGPASIEPPLVRDDGDPMGSGSERPDKPESRDERGSKSRFMMVLQGATVFVLLFVTLWIVLSRLLEGEDDAE